MVNVKDASGTMPELLIATKKDWKQREAIREQEPPRGRIPDGLSERERMERKLLTKRGKRLYSKRGQMIEAVFGQIKEVRRMRRFIRRGLSACASEWKLMCATHNLLETFPQWKGMLGLKMNTYCTSLSKNAIQFDQYVNTE